ncbi:class I SAM-dependent methyltransferase [Acaryochloris sp. IP29b_bin.137]|uniref:class I SAM-dependent methyltransferase n=1 Tax=Acaryochloris sp. IP29b_bin.137 TaxID=2969217 RepID=UPI002621C2D2|nr:class I SAM-dependent methyltransferase [Acaryochloris sp. IP29b_bin.137]
MSETQPQVSTAWHSPEWYQRCFAWAMATAAQGYETKMADRKRQLFADLQGEILELGPGAGPNLAYFKPQVHWLGLEPNPYMHPYLQQKADELGLEINVQAATLADMAIPNNSMDVVLYTLVLCSVPDLEATLQDILRVLKPGGRFLFIEHVMAPAGSFLRRVQTGLCPLWQVIGDGCRLDRDTGKVIATAGFASVDYQTIDAPVPIAVVKPHIIGVATKAA